MDNRFFVQPILSSPYEYPRNQWGLNKSGQSTQQIINSRRQAEFITTIPKPQKSKRVGTQDDLLFDESGSLIKRDHHHIYKIEKRYLC
jgi:type III restriction enzyme